MDGFVNSYGMNSYAQPIVGWGTGPLGAQSYVIRIDLPDAIFASGFDAP
jgi:hypothetical protein